MCSSPQFENVARERVPKTSLARRNMPWGMLDIK